jgi:hypothetical protein
VCLCVCENQTNIKSVRSDLAFEQENTLVVQHFAPTYLVATMNNNSDSYDVES